MREHCFVKDMTYSEFEKLPGMETDSVLHQSVALVLADPTYSTHGVPCQFRSAHGVFCTDNV